MNYLALNQVETVILAYLVQGQMAEHRRVCLLGLMNDRCCKQPEIRKDSVRSSLSLNHN